MAQTSELEVIVFRPSGGLAGSTVHSDARILIGKGPHCTIVVDDPALQSEHAVVHFTGRSSIIEPLPGATMLANGAPSESHLIQPQDTITLGSHTLRFVVHRTSATAPPAGPVQPAVVAPAVIAAPVVAAPVAMKPAATVTAATATAVMTEEMPKTRVLRVAPAVVAEAKRPPVEDDEDDHVSTRIDIKAPVSAPVAQVTRKEAKREAKKTETPRVEAQKVATAGALALKREVSIEDEEDEDEENDEPFVPFSLLDAMNDVATNSRTQGRATVVEAVRARDGRVVKILHLPRGRNMRLSSPVPLHCAHEESGALVVRGPETFSGHALKNGRPITLQSLTQKGAEGQELRFEPGVSVQLQLNGREALLLQHVARAPALAQATSRFQKPSREDQMAIGGAILFHIVAAILFGFSTSAKEGVMDPNEGRYVEVKIKDLELEPPPPTPEPVVTPTPPPEVTPQKAPPKRQPKIAQKPSPTPQPPAPAPPQKSAAAANLLSALSAGIASPNTTSSALAAATNLDAVAAPKGAGFKVSGVIGKMPGNEMKLGAAGSGVGRIDTKSATELTKNGQLGRVQGTAPSGKVRGVVEGPPPRSVQVQGSLDRGEIQKVVNDHLHEVQGCYERQLVKDPSLSGKIVSEWVIIPSGQVGTVKIKSSTVRNNEVANCIQAALKRWKFPQPKGGPVTVTYPFVFSTIGM